MNILVTGGSGFLGQALCRGLVQQGHDVTSFNRRHAPALDTLGVRQILGDLADRDAVISACAGRDAIFHNGAKVGVWGSYDSFYRANAVGTDNIIAACRRHGIGRLVYTSTPSVAHRGRHPVAGGTADTVPCGTSFNSPYPATKLIAEKAVLAASDANLATVALRPRLMWGPGDQQVLPRLVSLARAGRLRFVGDGNNVVDTTYIDNAAEAHLAAFERLAPAAACAGRAYFISNGEPRTTREIVNGLLRAAGAPEANKTIPFAAAYAIGAACEALWQVLRIEREPPMTRYMAELLSTTNWYDMAPAKRDFGYVPKVTIEEGLRRLAAGFQAEDGARDAAALSSIQA